MASIQLSMHEVTGDLPDVCVVCGAAARRIERGRTDVFPWSPSVSLPLCEPHKSHLRLRQLFLIGLYFSFLLFVASPLLIIWDSDQLLAREVRGENPLRAWLGLRIFPLSGAVLCLTCATLYYFLCIKVGHGDTESIVLSHV